MSDTWTDENGAIHQELADGITVITERGPEVVTIICRDNPGLFKHLCAIANLWGLVAAKPFAGKITKNGFGDDVAIYTQEEVQQ